MTMAQPPTSEGPYPFFEEGTKVEDQSDDEVSLVILEYKNQRMTTEVPELKVLVDNVITNPYYGSHNSQPIGPRPRINGFYNCLFWPLIYTGLLNLIVLKSGYNAILSHVVSHCIAHWVPKWLGQRSDVNHLLPWWPTPHQFTAGKTLKAFEILMLPEIALRTSSTSLLVMFIDISTLTIIKSSRNKQIWAARMAACIEKVLSRSISAWAKALNPTFYGTCTENICSVDSVETFFHASSEHGHGCGHGRVAGR